MDVLNISFGNVKILQDCLQNNAIKLTPFNKEKLVNELKNASVMDEENLPEDVVKVNSKVHLQEITSRKEFKFYIVRPAEANAANNKISMLAPISVAIIGYRKGAEVEWEMPAGIKKYKIVDVQNS